MLLDGLGDRVDTGDRHSLVVLAELLGQGIQLSLLLLDGVEIPVGAGVRGHGGDQHDRSLGLDLVHAVDHLLDVGLGGTGAEAAVVHAVANDEEVTAVLLHLLLHELVEIGHAVGRVPAADGGVDVGDGAALTAHVLGSGNGMAGHGGLKAGVDILDLIAEEVGQGFGEEHGVGALLGLNALGEGGASAPGDGIAVEEDGDVLACDELLDEILIDLQLALLDVALPGGVMLVGHADLPGLDLALAPEHGLSVHGDEGAGMVVVLLGGDDLDGGVLGDFQFTVLDDVVLALLVGGLAVVGGDGHDALDGVQKGLDLALV